MNVVFALAIGYWLGANSGGKDFGQLGQAFKSLYQTKEFAEVVVAARAQAATTLRQMADVVGGQPRPPGGGEDLVAEVRHLIGR